MKLINLPDIAIIGISTVLMVFLFNKAVTMAGAPQFAA